MSASGSILSDAPERLDAGNAAPPAGRPSVPTDWPGRFMAPTLEDFEQLADVAFAGLPEAFRALSAGVIIRIEDFPDEETLRTMECDTPFDLLGLFHGLGLAQQGDTPLTGQFPNLVYLYRRPILDYWAEHEETLGDIVTHVLVHEIGHHFGLSDADMEAIEAAADAP